MELIRPLRFFQTADTGAAHPDRNSHWQKLPRIENNGGLSNALLAGLIGAADERKDYEHLRETSEMMVYIAM